MKKKFLRFFSMILALVMLTSCQKSNSAASTEATDSLSNTNSNDVGYSFSIYDDNNRKYTDEETAVQKEFYSFINDLFIDSVTSNYINLLYTLENPKAMGIETDEITWGDYSIEAMKNSEQNTKTLYNELISYDYDSLDYEGRLIYDTLKCSLENDMIGCKYWYYAENFSPLNGIQTSIPITLAEIEFKDKKDIDNYLIIVKDTKRVINELIEFEKYRSENYGLFLSDTAADDVINQCNEFINASENILISSFDTRIADLDFLSLSEKNQYTKLNSDIVTNDIIPSFKEIAHTLLELKGTRCYESISRYENGDEYYAYLVSENSSSLSAVSDLLKITENYINDAIDTISAATFTDISEFLNQDGSIDPLETLNTLSKKLTTDFPAPATTTFELKYVPESLEASSSPAFYFIPPIDNIDKNVIYINGSDEYKDEDLYSVLAHEGYPGHLYQNSYFNSLNPNPIRSCLSFTGYNEGYAMYAERYAYDYKYKKASTAALAKANDILGYGIYAYIDLQVNFNNWDYDDVSDYLEESGYSTDLTGELYSIAINDPCIYLRYFLGLVQMIELQNTAADELDDLYTNITFNKFILEIGPTYFDIIEDYMYNWIEQIKQQQTADNP